MSARLFLFAVLLPLVSAAPPVSPGREREAGLPYLRNYSPKEYGAQEQNWAVTQDARGVIYAGNNDGVLIYDGVRWQTVRVANGSAVRSLDVDAKGTVYVGGRGDFGYLAADESGSARYVSLLGQLPAADRNFKDVWRTMVTPEGVVFATFQQLMRYTPEASGMRIWKPEKRFYRAFPAGKSIYVQDASRGLLRLDGDAPRPEPGGDRFANDRAMYCVAMHDGRLLAGSPEGLFALEGDRFTPYPTEADGLLRAARPYSCSALPDGSLAITTLRSGVVMLGAGGKLERALDEKAGLPSGSVTFAYPDREGGLWLAHVSGITRVMTPSPLSFFNERSGLKGFVAALARDRGALYAGTSSGLYRLREGAPGGAARWEAVRGGEEAVFSLLSTDEGLLVGSAGGVYQVARERTEWIRQSPNHAVADLTRSQRDPSLIYASGADGLALLRLKGGRWSDGGAVAAIRQAVRRAVESDAGLWLGADYAGALLAGGPPDAPAVESFGAKNGLPAGLVYPFRVAGRVVFLTTAAILQYDAKTRRFTPDAALTGQFPDRSELPLVLAENARGDVWAGAKTYGGLLRRQADGSYRLDKRPLRRMEASEILTLHLDDDGVVWAGTPDGIVRYDPAVPKNYAAPISALVRRAGGTEGKRLLFGGFGAAKSLSLPYDGNSLRFSFAAPTFDDESRTEYGFYLDGFDREWSPWIQETRKDYTNLPEGKYTFRVKARNLYGTASEASGFAFTVRPPWYRTFWGYGLRVLAVGLLVGLLVRWRLSVLAEQNRRLQRTVEERTAELRDKNSELTEVNNSLNQMNSEKNEFMGIAAHDLKNPLGAIRGYAEMLEEDSEDIPPGEVADIAAKIKKSANLMFALVSNLLDVNRIEQGKMELELAPCDLWDKVREAVECYRDRAAAKGIALHFDAGERPPLVMADANQLTQILDNLVSNAVKYSPPNKNIYVRTARAGDSVRAEVRDEGPGISAEDQKRLFGKFARLTARPTAGEHSTGLGLAIVKRLVESMHGKVWCESAPGQGATFLVEFPVAVEVSPAAGVR